MQNAADDEIASALEAEVQKVQLAAATVERALRDDDVPLTDEMVREMWEASESITALSRTLTLRVSEAHRVDRDE